MEEKKESPMEEFLCFRCVLECSETSVCLFSLFDSIFIIVGVNLGLHTHAKPALIA